MALEGRNKQIALTVAVMLVVAFVTSGAWMMSKKSSGLDGAVAELRALPLIGAVMAEVPGTEARLRAAIEEEERSPTRQGPNRAFIVIADLRKNYISPALAAADDASADAVMTARSELAHHLQQANLPACREFSTTGIQHTDKLDPEGQRLFRNVLLAMEAAYRNGRTAGAQPRPVANDQGFVAMLSEAGFTPVDFQKLGDSLKLSDAELCALQLRMDAAPASLAADNRGAFARYVLTH